MSSSVQHFTESSQVHDRRISQRILPKTLIYVACGESNGGMVLNVSDDGLAVSMAIAVGDEAYSQLNVRMNGLPQSIEVSGRMAWITKSKKRAGIQLMDVTDTQRQQIREWISLEGIRDVNLLPRAVARHLAPSPENADVMHPTEVVNPTTVFAEPHSTLLDAFGGTPPETLGPPLPELFASSPDAAVATDPPHSQGFDDIRTVAFRENEWDLASVTMVPRKKPKPEGLSAFALILLWIAIPSFGIGLLVGRRPLEQWLSRGDAGAKTLSGTTPSLSHSLTLPDAFPSAHQTDVKLSQEITSSLPINTKPLANDIVTAKPVEEYRSGDSSGPVDRRLLNSMSTQEARAYKNIGGPKAPAIINPPAVGFESKPNLIAQGSTAPRTIPPKPVSVQSAAVSSSGSAYSRPGTAQNSNSTISKPASDSAPPKDASTTLAHETLAAPSASGVPPGMATTPAASTAAPSNSGTNGNLLPNAATKNSSESLSSSNPAPSVSPTAPMNPSASASVAPSATPKLAPPSVQPPLRGVMNIARSTDQAFILKLPAESVAAGQAATMRMQRFVMVPQRGRWHRHNAVAKLKVGELLTHVSPEKPDAKVQPHSGDIVTVRAFVDKDGAVRELKPVSGRFALMPRVMRTVRDWQFDQTLVDGKPVQSEVNITVEYRGAN